ncbi:PAS domain-containing protein [Ideonella sp. 4Y11]|uniref:PAS domain-containing protein n=1 Tax=Ideonella aquatica TaxID=2824119 RepID=A0A940YTA9_9BURK|nr:CheR family methyltransferase [Ideonella aquatica]MBQ0958960.1 PAS domain-containing protein [Ideonella aquatica]
MNQSAAPVTATHELPWVVAIGASAGGLEALQQFFAALHSPTGAAFVVIQHLAPDHKSLMAELLGRHTTLPVCTAQEGMALQPDQVYLMPPGVSMSLAIDTLHFEPRPPQGLALPIDHFLLSLTQHAPERVVAVVLSGSGSDGSVGADALRRAGGYVLVQAPDSAKFDSMPRSVMASTAVDAALPPTALAELTQEILRGESARMGQGDLLASRQLRPALQRIFDALLEHSRIDFSVYKLPTVLRRLERRLLVTRASTANEYADRLEKSSEERERLRRELLIPVTSFFRDPASFEALTRQVLEPLLRERRGQTVRLWCAGCASGEEAYSLAMACVETAERLGVGASIKVFGTDVDPQVLDIAAQGRYPAVTAEALGPQRLERFFVRQGELWVVRPELRQLVLFARHNLLDDAPFTRMDLVSCRNTLIYFQTAAQERLLRRLQYALLPGGTLFLGASESLGPIQADFSTLDSLHKIYRLERPVTTASTLRDAFARSTQTVRPLHAAGAPVSPRSLIDQGLHQLMTSWLPASLLISSQRELIHAWGPTRRYLRMPEGEGSLDVMRMLPERLGPVVLHLQHLVQADRQLHRSAPVELEIDGVTQRLVVHAQPLEAGHAHDGVLVSIEALPPRPESGPAETPSVDAIGALEQELSATRQSLQATIEALESSNEELQSTNEELMSSNEELQSTNEELQSVNEELYTVNAEFNAKLDALNALNADLEGMAQATGLATIFVDQALCLVRFTPEAAMLFRLRQSDLGRSIEDFNSLLDYPGLSTDLRQALHQDTPIERMVDGPHDTRFMASMVGYSHRPGLPRRAVVTFIDITRVRDATLLQDLIDSLPEHIAVLDAQGTIRRVNRAWSDFARANGGEHSPLVAVGANYLAVLARSDHPMARTTLSGLHEVIAGRQPEFRQVYDCHGPSEQRWFAMYARPFPAKGGGLVITHFRLPGHPGNLTP